MKTQEFIQEFKQAKIEGLSHKIFKNVFQPTPSLEDVLKYVEESKTKGTYRENAKGLYIIHSHDRSDFKGYGAYDEFFNSTKQIYEDINETENFGLTVVASEIYRALVTVSGITKHTDQTDTVHWTTSGATIWRIFDEDNTHEYVVEAGDVFYVKKEVEHEVESLTPRAGLVISAGNRSKK